MAKPKKGRNQPTSKRRASKEVVGGDGKPSTTTTKISHEDVQKKDNKLLAFWQQYSLPLAVVLFLYFFNWASGDDQDIFSLKPREVHSDLKEAMRHPNCRFVMSDSVLPFPNAGWGIFSLVDLEIIGSKILFSDLRIQLVDIQADQYEGVAHLMHNYSWVAKYGRVEGNEVQTVQPGMSMLANSGWDNQFHGVAGLPTAPEPGMDGERGTETAGSFTHYNNRQFFAVKAVKSGAEIFINYGEEFMETKLGFNSKSKLQLESLNQAVEVLKENGMCLDNIASAPAPNKGGRGAFATRLLPKGTLVAPLPVLPLNRTSLEMTNQRKQLLLNYCYGHPNSTLLFFPYSPVANYINSASSNEQPNAVLRWSDRAWNLDESLQMSAEDILTSRRWGLLLEVAALRDILPGEQILIDYGRSWQEAWSQHVRSFPKNNVDDAESYVYANRMNQLKHIRTVDEQEEKPYPDNVQTSCTYHYSNAVNYPLWPHSSDHRNKITHDQWQSTKRFVPDYLRPCRVLARTLSTNGRDYIYTVEPMNPHTSELDSMGRIPRRERHVVTEMPRAAIQFTDKPYSTDQNLAGAFRHEIELPEGVFPTAWMDLTRTLH